MKYSTYLYSLDIVTTNAMGEPQYYEDDDGVRTYLIPGEKQPIFSEPIEFDSSISFSGGEAEAQEYGLSIADFDAVLLFSKNAYPLVEGSLIWTKSPVEYEKGIYLTDNMHDLVDVKVVKQTSADFIVKKISDSLNYTKVNLSAINK